ncbi:hypothetical protein PoB_003891200 [Plakobranchus ocellatus]|uniref:Uncharacterized protein n=1 Tax=Plakobranchus ocellatus TaxID=259542 RepID=A0AAV4AZT7_9GAST|nr:hypothetical protein PoB_003891200 [Plakobranchus ocellatus]
MSNDSEAKSPMKHLQTSPHQGDHRLLNPPSDQDQRGVDNQPRRLWRGPNPRQKGPCRSQISLASYRVTDAPWILETNCETSSLKN